MQKVKITLFFFLAIYILYTASVNAENINVGKFLITYDAVNGSITDIQVSDNGISLKNIDTSFELTVQKESTSTEKILSFTDFQIIEKPVFNIKTKQLTTKYKSAKGDSKIEVQTVVTVKDNHLMTWNITVNNPGSEYVMKIRYPIFHDISFSENGLKDELLWPMMTTILIKNPSTKIQRPLHYPRACMNLMDISGNNRGMALIGDKSLTMNEFGFSKAKIKGAINIQMTVLNSIAPKGSATYTFTTYFHKGNWRNACDYYHERFYRHFPKPSYPDWIKNSNGWLAYYWGQFLAPPYGKETRYHINETWRLGLNHLQYWGQTGTHACNSYPLPDPERGGEKAFEDMINQIRKAGIHVGGYFWSNGMGKYEVLSPSYRGVLWKDFPEDVRPPSWNWVIKNSLYATAERKPPTKKMWGNAWKRAKVKTVEEAAAKKLCPQVLHQLSYHSKEFRDWFFKWSKRYVKTYGADVLYYDVFGCRPKYREFNPNLKKFGDGTEGRLRIDFLKRIVEKLRPYDPCVVPFMEGIIDAYAVYAPALVSHRRRFMQGYRYTFPKHILYEGNANGHWVPGASLKALSNAFLDGNRFDLMLRWCNTNEVERMVWLRESLLPWINNSTYNTIDTGIPDANIMARIFNSSDTLGSQLITIRNIDKKAGTFLTLDKTVKNEYGCVVIPLFGPIQKISKGEKIIKIPNTVVSAILVITKPENAPLVPFIFPCMTTTGIKYSIYLINLSLKEKDFDVTMIVNSSGQKTSVWKNKISPLQVLSHMFVPDKTLFNDKVKRLTFTVATNNKTYNFRRTYDVIIEDPGFEWNDQRPLSKEQSRNGNSSLILKPGERIKLPVKLSPDTTYTAKTFFLDGKGAKTYGILYEPRTKKTLGIIRKIPSKDKSTPWKELSGKVKTGKDGWLYLYLYNKGTVPIYFDDVSIVPDTTLKEK